MLAKLKSLIPSKRTGMLILASLALLGVAYYTYTRYVKKQIEPAYIENNEYDKSGKPEMAELYLFYTTWCPACKRAKPEWERFKQEYDNKSVNGTTVVFREVDCDKDEETATRFEIKGYPTVKLVWGSKIVELDANPTYDTLLQFVNSVL